MHLVVFDERTRRRDRDAPRGVDLDRDVGRVIALIFVDVRAEAEVAVGVAPLEDVVLALARDLDHGGKRACRIHLGLHGVIGKRSPMGAPDWTQEERDQARAGECETHRGGHRFPIESGLPSELRLAAARGLC